MKSVTLIANTDKVIRKNSIKIFSLLTIFFTNSSVIASDLEIYTQASSGSAALLLMLDASGSMDTVDRPSGCELEKYTYYENVWWSWQPIKRTGTRWFTSPANEVYNQKSYPFDRYYCRMSDGKRYHRRIDELKVAVFDLVDSSSVNNNLKLGIGVYPKFDMTGGTYSSTRNGSIRVPVKPLDNNHKQAIKDFVKDISPNHGTPIAQAYAEAGAYMMGTSTAGANYSGITNSVAEAVIQGNPNYYKSPSVQNNECSSNVIYFLTDGVPNDSSPAIASSIMNQSMAVPPRVTPTNYTLQTSCSNSGSDAWGCIQSYSKKLLKTQNPSGNKIQTSTVGFGSLFNGLGEPKTLADCDVLSGKTLRNMCRWGIRGEGGSFSAKNSSDIVKTIFKTLENTQKNPEEPIATGVVSIPLDPITPLQSRPFGYMPILEPNNGSEALWPGNLKKYTIVKGALKSAGYAGSVDGATNEDGNVINSDGTFSKFTFDFWNRTVTELKTDTANPDKITGVSGTSDEGKWNKGGVYDKILYKKDATSDIKQRNLWVDHGDTLKNLTVSASKPSGFNTLSATAPAYSNLQKVQLLNFLGYAVPESVSVADGSELKSESGVKIEQDENHKVHGAVLHSKPKMLTTAATLKEDKVVSRKNYVMYGSFEGALRIVEDTTGEEVFNFIPKHVLDYQGQYLIPNSTKAPDKVGFGVDGDWEIYSDYKGVYSTSDKGTDDEALTSSISVNNLYAFGGLRMGGSYYYGLDLNYDNANQKFNDPKLLYKVGSGYGQNPSDGATYTGNFARMGQTWGKPSVGYIKQSNKKVMVNFLPGGYDLAYEGDTDPTFTSDKPAQGNAVYAVKVGVVSDEEETKTEDDVTTTVNSKIKVTTDATTGTRLWWASNRNSNTNNASMIHSVVSKVIPLDRDYDGFTDHLYFADLGGQVFRVDIDNSGSASNVVRVVKLFTAKKLKDSSGSVIPSTKLARFYESPLVTFDRWIDGSITAFVSLGSGNRSRPLETDTENYDAIYTFRDADVASNNSNFFTANYSLATKNLTVSDLSSLEFSGTSAEETSTVKTDMTVGNNRKSGWFHMLKHWDNDYTSETNSLKYTNQIFALSGYMYYTTFNKDEFAVAPANNNGCSASIKGVTQREVLCLPFGSCNKTVTNDQGNEITKYFKPSTQNAGGGLAENNFGSQNENLKVFDTQGNCIANCGSGGASIGIVKNDGNNCCELGSAGCEPINACISTEKYLFPTDWSEK